MVLSWEKPKRKMSKEDWKEQVFDGGPPGSYLPNMSDEDVKRWKAKHIKGKYARVEIRKELSALVVIVVSKSGTPTKKHKTIWDEKDVGHEDNLIISMNGKAHLSFEEFDELKQAVAEARAKLEEGEK